MQPQCSPNAAPLQPRCPSRAPDTGPRPSDATTTSPRGPAQLLRAASQWEAVPPLRGAGPLRLLLTRLVAPRVHQRRASQWAAAPPVRRRSGAGAGAGAAAAEAPRPLHGGRGRGGGGARGAQLLLLQPGLHVSGAGTAGRGATAAGPRRAGSVRRRGPERGGSRQVPSGMAPAEPPPIPLTHTGRGRDPPSRPERPRPRPPLRVNTHRGPAAALRARERQNWERWPGFASPAAREAFGNGSPSALCHTHLGGGGVAQGHQNPPEAPGEQPVPEHRLPSGQHRLPWSLPASRPCLPVLYLLPLKNRSQAGQQEAPAAASHTRMWQP